MFFLFSPPAIATDDDEFNGEAAKLYSNYYECWRCEFAWISYSHYDTDMDCPQCGEQSISSRSSTPKVIFE